MLAKVQVGGKLVVSFLRIEFTEHLLTTDA